MCFDRYPRISFSIALEICYDVDCVSVANETDSPMCVTDLDSLIQQGNEQRAIVIDVYACLIEQNQSVAFLCKHNKNLFLLMVLLCAVEVRMMVENPHTSEVRSSFVLGVTLSSSYLLDIGVAAAPGSVLRDHRTHDCCRLSVGRTNR